MPTVDELAERRLTAAEFAAYADSPLTDREREDIADLIRWFSRRYPTPAERLASNRRAIRSASHRRGIALAKRGSGRTG